MHKFSKFIHGCATIMPEEVQAVPYWIDDVTLADSIAGTEGARLLSNPTGQTFDHLIPHDKEGNIKSKPKAKPRPPVRPPTVVDRDSAAINVRNFGLCDTCDPDEECFCSSWAKRAEVKEPNAQKVSRLVSIKWYITSLLRYSALSLWTFNSYLMDVT